MLRELFPDLFADHLPRGGGEADLPVVYGILFPENRTGFHTVPEKFL